MSAFSVAIPGGAAFAASAADDLLSAAQRAHWLVRFGCRNGNCEACAATLLAGCVEELARCVEEPARCVEEPARCVEEKGAIVDAAAGARSILLCQCRARSDLLLAFDIDPTPGSFDQSRLLRATLIEASATRLAFALPAGRKPPLRAAQYALIEGGPHLLKAAIDATQSDARRLVLTIAGAHALTPGNTYSIRYPLAVHHVPAGDDSR